MRVAVTGATGFVGSHLVPALSQAGHDVIAIARHAKRPKNAPDNVEYAAHNIVDGDGLAEILTGCDAVVNLVAIIVETKKQTFTKVNVQGVNNVATAARQAGVKHLVHLGAIGAGPKPQYRYLFSKWEGEQAIRRSGVPFSIIRSSLIFGPGDGFFTLLSRLIRRTPFFTPVIGSGDALFQPISVEDLVKCLLLTLERGPENDTREVGGPDHLAYSQIVAIISQAIGARRILVHLPQRAVLPGAWLMQRVLSHPPITVDQIHSLQLHNVTAPDAVHRHFGFGPQPLAANADYLRLY